ncbi:DUF2681 domain-containing protein [Histophilus somni]|uniref:DUF2681 domain-containing protein n=1 Tax=Histophilus somni TaxID=731 RepID=A0AAX2S534_HISSO|nr:DUF2681 domain-containing protein [Histophilus somni]TEW31407.1 DUF2681 domain-containing protein [Histophilus somni]THA97455.1 DUF2681 domain-containing protein [Histophilus somni]
MTLQIIIAGSAVVVLIIGYVLCRLKQANDEINTLLKTNETLQTEKAVAQTQVKHFEVRKANEENANRSNRDSIIDRLQQSNDLRD